MVDQSASLYRNSIPNEDRELFLEALNSLIQERAIAHRLAVNIAHHKGQQRPDESDYGIPQIQQLSRRLGGLVPFPNA